MVHFQQLNGLLGIDEFKELESKYCPVSTEE
jgi:hypothetical protein